MNEVLTSELDEMLITALLSKKNNMHHQYVSLT